MKFFSLKHLCALFTLAIVSSYLSAQPYQKLYAHDPGTGLETGVFKDVENLNYIGPGGIHTIAVGTSNGPTQDGLLAYLDIAGNPILFQEWKHPGANPLDAEAVASLPSGDIISCYFDPVAATTHVVRTTAGGAFVWAQALNDFHVRGIDCDVAPYPSGEGIWLTGNSVANGLAALEGLDGTGAPVFALEHFLVDPIWNYANSMGFEVDMDPFLNELVVVGRAQIAGMAQTAMIVFRTDLFGGWIWGRSYNDPGGNDFYHGKALVMHPGTPSHYVISFEYSNTGTPHDLLGMMEIDPVGNIIWINTYFTGGFFAGTNYISNGIDTDAGIFLSSGWFDPAATPGNRSGYTFAVDIVGNPLQINEYAQAAYYPPADNALWDMDFDPMTGQHTVGGVFNTPATSGGWPQGANPRSFWLVNVDALGNSICNTWDLPAPLPLAPADPMMNPGPNVLPPPVGSPLFPNNSDQRDANECFFPKRGLEDLADAEGSLNVYFEDASQRIVMEFSGELTAAGSYQLMDLQGKLLQTLKAQAGKQYIDASALSAGIYMLRHDLPGVTVGTEKVLVK